MNEECVDPLVGRRNNLTRSLDRREGFGITLAGEISASPTDCGLFTIVVNISSQNPDCAVNIDWNFLMIQRRSESRNSSKRALML